MKISEDNKIILGALIVAFLIIGMSLIHDYLVNVRNVQNNRPPEIQLVYDINDPFTEGKVREYLVQLHVKYPDVAVAQMKLESANGTSKVFCEGNNLFGLKVPVHRPTTALGTKNNHAYYSHWRQSVLDYAMFCSYTMDEENSSTQRAWLVYLGKYYAADTSYVSKLDKILVNQK